MLQFVLICLGVLYILLKFLVEVSFEEICVPLDYLWKAFVYFCLVILTARAILSIFLNLQAFSTFLWKLRMHWTSFHCLGMIHIVEDRLSYGVKFLLTSHSWVKTHIRVRWALLDLVYEFAPIPHFDIYYKRG